MKMVPKAGIFGFGWFGVWYTPGVSAISTAIRDEQPALLRRCPTAATWWPSSRTPPGSSGDGDCTPTGGLGVMEGKAFLMYYLGGVDAIALCINSHDDPGRTWRASRSTRSTRTSTSPRRSSTSCAWPRPPSAR